MKFEEKPRFFDAAENPPELACRGKNILTRRDHFAMAALTGLLSNGLVRNMDGPSDVSGLAYELADAMEAERNKEGAE